MHAEYDRIATFWLNTALLVTTRSTSTPAVDLGRSLPPNWMTRTASLRWFAVWRNHPDALQRLRAVVLPEPWWDDIQAWYVVCTRQLFALALTDEQPDSETLVWAEGRFFERLAAPWGGLASRNRL